jgi:O-antigen/teichoic acid export membrane protein
MARRLGASDFGLFSFAFSFAGIFAILIDPGLNILATRDVAKNSSLSSDYSSNIFMVKLILSIITFVLVWGSILVLGYGNRTVSVVAIMGFFLY